MMTTKNVVYRCNQEGCSEKGQESIGSDPVNGSIPRCFGCGNTLQWLRYEGEPALAPAKVLDEREMDAMVATNERAQEEKAFLSDQDYKASQTQVAVPKKGTKKAAQEELRSLLQQDEHAINALLIISTFQTPSEFQSGTADVTNGIGFGKFDAEILCSFAKQYRSKGWLSPKQRDILKRRMPKYAGQMIRLGYKVEGFKVICSSCKTLLREGKLDPQGRHSHGICGLCAMDMMN